VSAWLSSCLDFSTCAWCVDGGTCGTSNLWPGPLAPQAFAACAIIDGGVQAGGGWGTATCAFNGPAGSGWSIATAETSVAPGQLVCARALFQQTPVEGVHMNLRCENCEVDAGQTCLCTQESGCPSGSASSGPLEIGPFRVPEMSCATLVAGISSVDEDGGTLTFDQAWLWVTDGGCAWNDALQCPGS
jgi:hypothetical protein